ncbi:UDP-N-acetylmuramate--L-alanine ligase [Candidatus Sumerlaeota bacterium]|nr:UDP-N-acetylmuramate--L-alanine ligase [Candidatus Sumerlaeota bacterium]
MLDCKRIHFIGIGGVGMSGLALVLAQQGYTISGSDIAENTMTRRLRDIGVKVYIGHNEHNLGDAELVVVSSAIKDDNPELIKARALNIPILHRSEVLGAILNNKRGIAVTGTHGKTTTTSMISLLLKEAGLNPTILIGGELNDVGGNAECGPGEFVIAEADESDGSFLNLEPEIAVITNIESEHLDYYKNFEHELEVFSRFAGKVKEDGVIFAALDDYGSCRIIDCVPRPFFTYSVRDPEADIVAADIQLQPWSSDYMFIYKNQLLGRVHLSVPGLHNVANSLASLGVGIFLGIDFEQLAEIIATFNGASRRFEIKGKSAGITVIDDYAHHPTEVAATLKVAKKVASAQEGRVIALFQPHRYTRTLYLGLEFGSAFELADIVVITDIYPAGEKPIPGVSGEIIAQAVREHSHPKIIYCPALKDIEDCVIPLLQERDIVLTLGAGNIWTVGEKLLATLRSNETKETIPI